LFISVSSIYFSSTQQGATPFAENSPICSSLFLLGRVRLLAQEGEGLLQESEGIFCCLQARTASCRKAKGFFVLVYRRTASCRRAKGFFLFTGVRHAQAGEGIFCGLQAFGNYSIVRGKGKGFSVAYVFLQEGDGIFSCCLQARADCAGRSRDFVYRHSGIIRSCAERVSSFRKVSDCSPEFCGCRCMPLPRSIIFLAPFRFVHLCSGCEKAVRRL